MDRNHSRNSGAAMTRGAYQMLALNLFVSFIIMYVAMFAMIYSWAEFIQNINFLYMALIMWAPMAAVMLLTMKSMYSNVRLNLALYVLFGAVFVVSLVCIRHQALVGDRQFLRSMIPHHSGAVLMCEKATLADQQIKQLCDDIIRSQTKEIDQMKAILARLG